jgi:hypothetical protein
VKGGRRSGHAKDRAIPKFIRQVDRESVTCALRGACLGSPLQNPGKACMRLGHYCKIMVLAYVAYLPRSLGPLWHGVGHTPRVLMQGRKKTDSY